MLCCVECDGVVCELCCAVLSVMVLCVCCAVIYELCDLIVI